MPQTLILAKSIREANQYAKLAGLQRGRYRAVLKAASIRGVRRADVHVLPSFLARPDRFNILTALKSSRHEVFYVDPADLVEKSEYVVELERKSPKSSREQIESISPDNSENSGDIPAPELVMSPEADIKEPGEQTGKTEPSEDPAPAEESKSNRRRSRCKNCNELHFPEDDCREIQDVVTAQNFFG